MYDAFVLKLDARAGQPVNQLTSGIRLRPRLRSAVDHQGSAYVVGSTGSADFPIQAFSPEQPVFQPALKGPSDVFVSKISPTGLLEYSTYYGGSSGDGAIAAVVDEMGTRASPDSPTDRPPVKFVIHPDGNGFGITPFAAKLDPFGSKLVYSSWLSATYNSGTPTAGAGRGRGGPLWATGVETFPTTPGAFQETVEGYASRAFALKINPFGSGFDWSTFLGATPGNHASAVARGPAGQVYVGGHTPSTDLPIPGCFLGSRRPWIDLLSHPADRLSLSGLARGSSRRLDRPRGGSYPAVVVGGTESPNMPTVDPLPDSAAAGSFIARIDPTTPFSRASTIYLEAHGGLVNETAGVVNLTVRRLCGTAGAASAPYLTEPGTASRGQLRTAQGTLASEWGHGAPHDPGSDPRRPETHLRRAARLRPDPRPREPLRRGLARQLAGHHPDQGRHDGYGPRRHLRDQGCPGGTGPAWEATTDVPWLSLDETSGFGPSTVKVYVDISGLTVGEHNGQVMVIAPGSPTPKVVDSWSRSSPAVATVPLLPKRCRARSWARSTSMTARRQARRNAVQWRPLLAAFLGALWLTGSSASAQVVEYYHLDGLGNVRAVTDALRNVIERHDYLPFGEECTTGPAPAILASGRSRGSSRQGAGRGDRARLLWR